LERSRRLRREVEGEPALIRKLEEAAYDELVDIIAHYYEISDELGDRFFEAFQETLHYIVEFPRAAPLVRGRRRFSVPGFPYGVFMDPDSQVVLGIRHNARNPERHPRMN
jgi:hypothetical protein